jgi:hypothetical protein
MSKDLTSASLELNPNDADVLIRFVGKLNENLKIVEKAFQAMKKILKELRMQSKIYMHQHRMEVSSQRNKYRW